MANKRNKGLKSASNTKTPKIPLLVDIIESGKPFDATQIKVAKPAPLKREPPANTSSSENISADPEIEDLFRDQLETTIKALPPSEAPAKKLTKARELSKEKKLIRQHGNRVIRSLVKQYSDDMVGRLKVELGSILDDLKLDDLKLDDLKPDKPGTNEQYLDELYLEELYLEEKNANTEPKNPPEA